MDKLKPCPFCGHEAMISYNSNYDFQAYCTNDACFMSQIIMEDMETEEQARTAWNKRAPAVPAVPVVHGKWEWLSSTYDRTPCEMRYRCSKCHHETITHDHAPWEKYCPNCGAKMDLEEQNASPQ